jgi:hypothetical protein
LALLVAVEQDVAVHRLKFNQRWVVAVEKTNSINKFFFFCFIFFVRFRTIVLSCPCVCPMKNIFFLIFTLINIKLS